MDVFHSGSIIDKVMMEINGGSGDAKIIRVN